MMLKIIQEPYVITTVSFIETGYNYKHMAFICEYQNNMIYLHRIINRYQANYVSIRDSTLSIQ